MKRTGLGVRNSKTRDSIPALTEGLTVRDG